MAKFRAYYTQSASVTVEVEIDDEELAGLGAEEIRGLVDERAADAAPGDLCIHCCGMGFGANFSRDLDGELVPCEGDYFIERLDG